MWTGHTEFPGTVFSSQSDPVTVDAPIVTDIEKMQLMGHRIRNANASPLNEY